MVTNNPSDQHFVQRPKKKNRAPLLIAAGLAFFMVGAALTLLLLNATKTPSMQVIETSESDKFASIDYTGPARMGSGGIIFSDGMKPLETQKIYAGSAPEPFVAQRAAGQVDVVVYVDYRCPHCMMFEHYNAEVLERAANSANATVEIKPLTFMDRFADGSAYSSRAFNVLACTAEYHPESAWNVHSLLLNSSVQPEGQGPGHDNETLLGFAQSATGSQNGDYTACILENKYVDFAGAINDWTFMHPAPGTDDSIMVEGTPLVLVNGIEFDGDMSDPNNLFTFMVEQGVNF